MEISTESSTSVQQGRIHIHRKHLEGGSADTHFQTISEYYNSSVSLDLNMILECSSSRAIVTGYQGNEGMAGSWTRLCGGSALQRLDISILDNLSPTHLIHSWQRTIRDLSLLALTTNGRRYRPS
jgi:hypothetical protein